MKPLAIAIGITLGLAVTAPEVRAQNPEPPPAKSTPGNKAWLEATQSSVRQVTETTSELNRTSTAVILRLDPPDGIFGGCDCSSALMSIAQLIIDTSTALGNGLTQLGNGQTALGNAIGALGMGVDNGFTAVFTALGNIGTALANLSTGITNGFNALGQGLTQGFTQVLTAIGNHDQAEAARFAAVGTALQNGFTATLTAIGNHEAAEAARFQALVQLIQQIAQDNLRLQIERNLSEQQDPVEQERTRRVVQFELPSAFGGRLEFVRQIVSESIANVQAAGLVISADAQAQFNAGDAQFSVGNYREAFDAYRQAYQAAAYY